MSPKRCKSSKSFLIRSSQVIFGLPLLLLPSTVSVSTILIGSVIYLLLTCPNHLNLPSLILSEIQTTPNPALKTPFLILSNLVCPHIHLNILISATSSFRAWIFLMAQQSVPYSIEGLIATLKL
ncbi:hypothetical protein Hanom_Chr03g00181011 [Helianthus anomalus]